MITTQQDQARQVAALEAAFVAEMLGLESLKLVAAKAGHIEDLRPHVEGWLSDWRDYHARNGHSPLVKAALTVALQRVEPYRVAAAVWTFHHAAHNSAHNLSPKVAPPQSASPESAAARRSLQIPPRGPRSVKQTLTVDGQPIEVPGAVADFLRDLAHDGTGRARPETVRALEALIPWAKVTRDPSAKVINHKRLYVAGQDLREALK